MTIPFVMEILSFNHKIFIGHPGYSRKVLFWGYKNEKDFYFPQKVSTVVGKKAIKINKLLF